MGHGIALFRYRYVWLRILTETYQFQVVKTFHLIRVRPGVGSGCSLRGADFLQILDGAANDSIISEHWAGEHTKTSDSYSPEPRAQPRGSKYRQIQTPSPSPSRSCCLTLWRKQIKRWRLGGQSIEYSILPLLPIQSSQVCPMLPRCPEDLAPLFMFCQGWGWAGLG